VDFCQGGIGVAGKVHTGVCLTLRRSHVGRREAICWHEVLQHKLGPGRHHILELGVGAGLNLFHDCLPLAITDFLTVKAQHLNKSFQPCVGAREVDAYTPLTHDFQID